MCIFVLYLFENTRLIASKYDTQIHRLDQNCSHDDLARLITDLNDRDNIDGILVQLPVGLMLFQLEKRID